MEKQPNLVRQKSVHFLALSPSAAAIKLPKLYCCTRHLKIQLLSPYDFKCCYQDNLCRGKNKTFYCETTNPRWSLVEYQNAQVSVGTGRFSMVREKKTRKALWCLQEMWSFLFNSGGTCSLKKILSLKVKKKTKKQYNLIVFRHVNNTFHCPWRQPPPRCTEQHNPRRM